MKSSTKRQIVRTAFWSYDLYPFVLSGEVDTIGKDDKGTYVRPKGYDRAFYTLAVIDGELGEDIARKIDELRAERKASIATIESAFKARALAVLPFEVPSLKRG